MSSSLLFIGSVGAIARKLFQPVGGVVRGADPGRDAQRGRKNDSDGDETHR